MKAPMTMNELKMKMKDVLNTDLHGNYEGDIDDVYDMITLPTQKSEDVDLKKNPLSAEDNEKIKILFSQKRTEKWRARSSSSRSWMGRRMFLGHPSSSMSTPTPS